MKSHLLLLMLLLVSFSCADIKQPDEKDPIPEEKPKTHLFAPDDFVMGVDLSYVNQIEDHGGVYRDSSKVRDPFRIMKDHGANMVRVRLWHNPVWVRTAYNNNFGSQAPLSGYPFTKEGQSKFMIDLCQNTLSAGGSGVMYWQPTYITSQAKTEWGTGSTWENAALFDFTGNALSAMDYMRYSYTIQK